MKSNHLRAARTLAGLSQADLASRAGVHAKSVAYWERQDAIGTSPASQKMQRVFAEHGLFFEGGRIITDGPIMVHGVVIESTDPNN